MAEVTKATYWQRGETIDYKNETESPIEAGTILELGDTIGVAGELIPPGGLGSAHIEGVFRVPKEAEEIALGKVVYLKKDSGKATADKGEDNVRLGHSVAKAESADAEVLVKINV